MKTNPTNPETVKTQLLAKVTKDAVHIADLIRWGSWTLAAEYAQSVSEMALQIRQLEQTPAPHEMLQDEFSLFANSSKQTQFPNFSTEVSHHSSRDLPGVAEKRPGSVVFGGLR